MFYVLLLSLSNVMCYVVPVYAPLLRLSPPPSDKDYFFNLDDSEGVSDLFDVPLYL